MTDSLKPIRNEADYIAALDRADRFFDDLPQKGTRQGDEFEVLTLLISKYEDEHYPIQAVDPVDLLHFAIKDMGRTQTELATLLGSRARASEILNRKRSLTLDMIRAISAAWRLPVEALTPRYKLAEEFA